MSSKPLATGKTRRVTLVISIVLVAMGSYWLAVALHEDAPNAFSKPKGDPSSHQATDAQAAPRSATANPKPKAQLPTPAETVSQSTGQKRGEARQQFDYRTGESNDDQAIDIDASPPGEADAGDRAQKSACWTSNAPLNNGFRIALDATLKTQGDKSATIFPENETPQSGNLFQSIDATGLQGKHIHFSADMRTELATRRAGLWIRAYDSQGETIAIKQALLHTADYDLSGNIDWTKLDVDLDIPREARMVSYGMTMGGVGQTWIDNAHIEVSDSAVVATGTILNTNGFRPDPNNLAVKPANLDFESDLGCLDVPSRAE